jgi:hypothetical protein
MITVIKVEGFLRVIKADNATFSSGFFSLSRYVIDDYSYSIKVPFPSHCMANLIVQ